MTRTLIYIGAGALQLPAISWAKEQGLKVIVTDVNPHAPGIAIADGHEAVAGDDVNAITALACAIAGTGELAGCYCGSDFGLPSVAAVGRVCGVPGPSPESVALALDKNAARRVLGAHGLPIPPGASVDTPAELDAWARAEGYPVIVKPVDSSGSRGVRTLAGPADGNAAFAEARRHSSGVLVEKVVVGEHIDVNGLFADGAFHPCGQLVRYFSPPPHNYPVWGCEPSGLDTETEARVYAVVERGARALGIDAGPVKADVVVTAEGPVILEISPRFHGDVSTSFVTPLATGRAAPAAWFAHLAGKPFEDLLPSDRHAAFAGWMGVFPDRPGAFEDLEGMDEALAVPGIRKISVLKKKGYRIDAVSDNLALLGFLWGVGETREDLRETLQKARRTLRTRMGA
ncbi:MAG: ATP-grasp domain-containing protein [Alphaproteobacteria bacterium]|nr:ATP-grasp domain-containing protein [Alphaproteobacteria bacterium]